MQTIKKIVSAFFELLGFEIRRLGQTGREPRRARELALLEAKETISELLEAKETISELLENEKLIQQRRSQQIPGLLGILGAFPQNSDRAAELYKDIRGQLAQDFLALCVNGFKSGGFFVEFGATNGLDLSNTHLLEHRFKWSGILVEPGRVWQAALKGNRSCHIETKAVWSESGLDLNFIETTVAELSTFSQFKTADFHTRVGEEYVVRTISLMDLLEKYDAPRRVDFLSMDTEGSELDILMSLDFERYSFALICVEHNFSDSRVPVNELLVSKGYRRVLEKYSQFDDWYVDSQLSVFNI
jgi:FkbM family methyltransferase